MLNEINFPFSLIGTDRAEPRLIMIDFHNHTLPNVDDGSKSLEMSLEMLTHAADQGIT